jgi:hypothetical protein
MLRKYLTSFYLRHIWLYFVNQSVTTFGIKIFSNIPSDIKNFFSNSKNLKQL